MRLIALLFCAAFALGASAAPLTDEQVSEQIDTLIAQMHPKESPDTWRAFGPSAPRIIIQKYKSTDHKFKKMRLLHGLAAFDDPAATDFLKSEAMNSTSDVIRNGALRTLGYSQGEKELGFIKGFLDHDDPQTRYAAADAIHRMGGAEAKKVYDGYLAQEKAPWIKDKLAMSEKEPPRKMEALNPEVANKTQFHPDFLGKWKGLWITHVAKKGLVSTAAELSLRQGSDGTWGGQITLKGGKTMLLGELKGEGAHMTGKVAKKSAFAADLSQHEGYVLVQLTTADGGTLVVERASN